MPRRALRKVDSRLDLSRHYRLAGELPRPLVPAALFSRVAPLEIEVGSGKGLFLASAAEAFPQHNFLGIEVSHKYARFAAARLAKADHANALVIDGDALRLFAELPDACAAAVHVYFPDPWWKKRHRKRRVMNERFLKDVERVLQPGGVLHFWTDVQEYFQATVELIQAATSLAGPVAVAERPPEHDLDFRTHFERRVRQAGMPVYRSMFHKSSAAPHP